MKYTKEDAERLVEEYSKGVCVADLAIEFSVPERSIIAKLSSLGVYRKKQYLNKRGEIPVKKFEYLEKLSVLINEPVELLDSLEKVNKNTLKLIIEHLEKHQKS